VHIGGLAAVVRLPEGVSDVEVTRSALDLGMAPSPLSSWFAPGTPPESGLLLGIAPVSEHQIPGACERLHLLISTGR
jgi:GntR family transcriptional regulator/MocR family aminotransferase